MATMQTTVTLSIGNEDRADYKCAIHQSMIPDLTLVRDVERGTSQIRKKGEVYLPKWPGEKPRQYKRRLEQAILFNSYRKIRDGLVGMVLKTNPILGNDIDPEIKQHLENLDLAGTHFDVLAKDILVKALEGHCFVFVDMAKPLPPGSTAYQAAAQPNRRPFWIVYAKDAAINFDDDRVNGEQVLTMITFLETATIKVGKYGRAEVNQYRTLRLPVTAADEYGNPTAYGPMEWELEREVKQGDKTTLKRIDGGTTKLQRIPVAIIYTCKQSFMQSDPRLLDLAHLNIAHLRKWSYLEIQERSLNPITVVKRVDAKPGGAAPDVPKDGEQSAQPEELDITGNVTVDLFGKDDSIELVQSDATCVEAAQKSLDKLEDRMSAIGLSIISAKGTEATATEKILDQAERTSELANIARALQDGLETCLGFHAMYLGKADANGDGGSVTVTVDAGDKSAVTAIKAPKDPATPADQRVEAGIAA